MAMTLTESKPTGVEPSETVGWGYSKFSYNKDQVLKLYDLLDSHQWNAVHCIEDTHLGDIFDINPETLQFVGMLVEKLCAAMVLVGRNPARVWDCIISHNGPPQNTACS